MNIFKKFFSPKSEREIPRELSSVYLKFKEEFSELEEKDCMILACLSALLARVAFVDMEITEDETEAMVEIIAENTQYPRHVAEEMVAIASQATGNLVDIENHLSVRPLNELLDQEEKGEVLKLLFRVAASDGKVENLESENIRIISKELRVTHRQFVEAKLTVKNRIEALRA